MIDMSSVNEISETKKALCGVCPGGCAVLAKMQDGKLADVAPLENVPFGNLCVRGKAAPEIVYSPDRIKKPLLRIGARGEGRFREASWDEALDYAAQKMLEIKKNFGPQAMASHSGRGAFEQSLGDFCNGPDMLSLKLMHSFGSPNAASDGSLCYVSYGMLAPVTTIGIPATELNPDIENSNLIVVWGANPVTDSPPFMFKRIVQAQKNGKKIIAIDPMRSDIARRANQWISLRSGTDGALALGLIHVVINEELYDQDFVEKWTVGFEELKAYVQQFTPDEVENITGVPGEQVVSLAREIANAKNAALRNYTGLEYSNSGVQTLRAVLMLWALTGNLDVPGGLNISLPPKLPIEPREIPQPELRPFGADEYPVFYEITGSAHFMEFPKAVLEELPYAVKGLLINGSSTLTSYPQPEKFIQAYEKLDLMVVIDRFMTKDALYADVVLPAATFFEIDSYQRYPGGFTRLRRKVVEPVGEAKNDILIMGELAKRLGFGDQYPQSEEEVLARAFARDPELLTRLRENEDGVQPEKKPVLYKKYEQGLLREDGMPGFPTPSGKLEFVSALLEKHGYEGLPRYVDPVEGPNGDQETFQSYPLVLNTGTRIQSTFRSQHLNIPSLVRLQDKPLVHIHNQDAEQRGIKDGDRVKVTTKRGQVYFWARVGDLVRPGSVEINQGGGSPIQVKAWREGNVNVLTDFDNRDPISGFPVFKALLCEIEPAPKS
ncbi:molybdopterin-containing oxidoreductase family protein [Dehalobacterium formicoaceticum]|uniref:Molybdopterin-dependent oxidoreductase n=1 Tax=Dehalobacterium formicoaceticum TaxID=51515 RepID=A0ABT1Y7R9_9FIRM|nr:molybdopterin-dependent oxidoreductase [Dehalobacterium formicoaceticum]MCR6546930.1 molybdopterin-dependent oxidoreductase [Dehalobacterium formicoaceticum]